MLYIYISFLLDLITLSCNMKYVDFLSQYYIINFHHKICYMTSMTLPPKFITSAS